MSIIYSIIHTFYFSIEHITNLYNSFGSITGSSDSLLSVNPDQNPNANPSDNNSNDTLSKDFTLILGASLAMARQCPGPFMRKSSTGLGTFLTTGGMYTLNKAIANPEGVKEIRLFTESIVNRNPAHPGSLFNSLFGSRSGSAPGSASNFVSGSGTGSNFVNDTLSSAPDSLPGLETLILQHNTVAVGLYSLVLGMAILFVVFGLNFVIHYYRENLFKNITNKWLIMYMKYQYFLLRLSTTILPIYLLVCFGFLIYGLHFMVFHPIPESLVYYMKQ